MTRTGLGRIKAGLISGVALAAVLVSASQAEAIYLFYMRKELAHLIGEDSKKVIGRQVVVTDELLVVWPEVQQRATEFNGEKYVVFDTTYFHCAVPSEKMGAHLESIWQDAQKAYGEVTTKIEEVNEQQRTGDITPSQGVELRRELYWKLYAVWKNKPILTIYGTVDRHDFWGAVNGKGAGVATEAVSIVVDKIEKPRRRWYKTLDE